MKTFFAALAAALLLPATASAAAVVQFNGAAGETVPSYTEFDSTFSTVLGTDVQFDFLNGSIALRDSANESPVLVVFNGTLDGTIAVDVGDNGGDQDRLFLRLFDLSGVLLNEDTDTLPTGVAGHRTLIAAASGIAFAIIGGVDSNDFSSVLIDNFTISGLLEPLETPAPGGLVLFASGAAVLAFRGRKRRA